MLYGVDVASYQGKPDWRAAHAAGIRFGFSKVTQGTSYVNPTWPHNRTGMLALAVGGDFLPGAYHFLTSTSDPAVQARHFVERAGDLDGFAVALDVEPTEGSRATAAQARAWAAEFKRLTGGRPLLGYFPGWWWRETGRPDLTFFDGLWQSSYVDGSGDMRVLYGKVPATWWTAFGGEPISILQFSSSATVPGISGRCDINAYRGTLAELRAIALGEEDPMAGLTVDEIANAVVTKLLGRRLDDPAEDDDATIDVGRMLWRSTATHAEVRELRTEVAELRIVLDAIQARLSS